MYMTRFLGNYPVRRIFWITVCMLAAALTACGSSSNTAVSATSQTTATADAKITISNFQFTSPPSVRPGAQIAVTNSDPAEHSVTADSGDAFNVDIESNGTATFTAPSEPGTYAYHCSYHPMMHGQLIVK